MYKMNQAWRGRTAPKGMTMVELILALAVASGFLVLMVTWQKNASDDLKAKRSADYLLTFTQAAGRYVATNRGVLVKAMRGDTSAATLAFCSATPVNLAIPSKISFNCVADLAKLVEKNALPSSFSGTKNAYGQDLVAIFRLANPATGATDVTFENGGNQDIEILVVASAGDAISKSNELGLAAELLGGVGGLVPPAGTSGLCPSGKDVCGSGWSSTLAAFGACRKGVDAGC